MDIFNAAEEDWKALSTERGWYTVFGDIYMERYPVEISDASQAYKQSIYHGDDSVHAFDAKGIRETIISRVIKAEERGQIRDWYTDLGFFAESIIFLRSTPEEEVDFAIRRSNLADNPLPADLEQVRQLIINDIDPTPPKDADGTLNQFSYLQQRDKIIMASKPHLEMYGLIKALSKRLYALSKEDLSEILNIIFDPELADKYLRKRFVKLEGDYKPLIGTENPEGRNSANFTLNKIGGGNKDYYQFRICLFWLYALLSYDEDAKKFLLQGIDVLYQKFVDLKLTNNKTADLTKKYQEIIYRTVELARIESVYNRYTQLLKTQYAGVGDYRDYANRLFHLLNQRNQVIALFDELKIPYADHRYNISNMLLNIAMLTIESVMSKFEEQIPAPAGQEEMKKVIMKRRKDNLRNEVLIPKIRYQIINEVQKIEEAFKTAESSSVFEPYLRAPSDILYPRGETYFREMKDRIKEQMDQMGGQTLTDELQQVVDTPDTIVKQFGNEASRFLMQEDLGPVEKLKYSDIYAVILSLKASSLLFDDATTTSIRRKTITKSLFDDYYHPQIEMLRTLNRAKKIEVAQPTKEVSK